MVRPALRHCIGTRLIACFIRYYPVLMVGAGAVTFLLDNQLLRTRARRTANAIKTWVTLTGRKSRHADSADDRNTSTLADDSCVSEKPLPELPPPIHILNHRSSTGLSSEVGTSSNESCFSKSLYHGVRTCSIAIIACRMGSGLNSMKENP